MPPRRPFNSHHLNGPTLRTTFPEARNIAFLPLWDYNKGVWHSALFLWTKSPSRVFTTSGELSYLKAFGMTIMAEVSHIESLVAKKAKSDLLGSISHELRSPLHGILAAVSYSPFRHPAKLSLSLTILKVELLQDTRLDVFQGKCSATRDALISRN